MMQSLRQLARRQGELYQQVRCITQTVNPALLKDACNIVPDNEIPSMASPFLRYTSPYPQLINFKEALASVQPTQVTTLANGMRVATEQIPYAESATVGIWIDTGSRYETDEENGTAHFLEHMIFKGTKNRSQRDLELEFENMGGHLNAYTSREYTSYHARVLKQNVPKAVDLIADILQNSSFSEETINYEKQVILREMQEVMSNPEEVVFDHLHATAYQHSPLGKTILGPTENIQSMTRDKILNYIKKHYTAGRMVLVGAGAVDHDALVKQAEELFNTIPETPVPAAQLVKEDPAYFTPSEVRCADPDLPHCHIIMAWQGCKWTDPDSIPLMVMQSMIGSWDRHGLTGQNQGSMLAQWMSHAIHYLDEYPCDSYMAFNTNYHDSGLFGVYSISPPKAALQYVGRYVCREMTRMVYSVSDYDATRGRNQLKASMLFASENSTGLAEEIARHLLAYGRRIDKNEMFARIDDVSPQVINAVADRYLYDQEPVIATLGDAYHFPEYLRHKQYMWWRRY